MLTRADFGLAALFWATLSLLDWTNRISLGQQIVQSKLGDMAPFRDTCHALQCVAGVFSACALVVFARPIARCFDLPEANWAFALLALAPLINGFTHLDNYARQRTLEYGPAILCDVVPQVVITAAAFPLAILLNDFRVMLYLELAKIALGVAMTHILARMPYRWEWDREYLRSMLAFGWPLLLNGFMMFLSQQGDQMLIGATFSLDDLGSYSIAFSLALVPWFIFGQVGSSLMLPTLARQQDDRERFERHYRRCLEFSVVGALIVLGPLVVAGDPLVRLLYGPKYSGVGTLMTVFGAMVALRFFRWAPAVAAMSQADTKNQFIGNVVRAASLPLALLVVALGTRNVAAVAMCGLVGESLAILVSVLRVRKRQGIGLDAHTRPILFLLGWIVIGAAARYWLGDGCGLCWSVGAVLALWIVGTFVSLCLFPDLLSIYRRTFVELRIPVLLLGKPQGR